MLISFKEEMWLMKFSLRLNLKPWPQQLQNYAPINRELKHARFCYADGNRKRTFCVSGPYCLPRFLYISKGEKILSNVNVVVWGQIKSENSSLPVAVRISKTRVLKLPNVKPTGGGRQGIGRGFDRSLWPRGRAFELSCCPGSRDIWIFVRARDHKSVLGWGISLIFDLTFLPGGREFDSNLWENVKIPPYTLPPQPPPPPASLTLIGALPCRYCSRF